MQFIVCCHHHNLFNVATFLLKSPLSEYFLIRLMSALKSFSAVMFALALYLRGIGQVLLSVWHFSAWVAFSGFLIFSSGCKVSLYRRFQSEGTFSCRLLVCTFSWLVAKFSSLLTARSSSSLMVFSGSICTSWFEAPGTNFVRHCCFSPD